VVFHAAREGHAATVSAMAVHGVMTGVFDSEHKFRLNHFDLLVPDGQPVRWALNLLHKAKILARVYGPTLMLRICARAAADGVPVYLYGSTAATLAALNQNLMSRFPQLLIAGAEPSKFRRLATEEKLEIAGCIQRSGARIVFVGLGCPRQEAFAFEFRDLLNVPIIAVGAAFPFLAGLLPQAPHWMQEAGLEWLFRLVCEPRRLWRRYILLNPAYLLLLLLQALSVRFPTAGRSPSQELLNG
jgi:N-acetylglucosaminyldiphosphoundecaprenol N-acetyl-beta-D-mannosaminyltransferase